MSARQPAAATRLMRSASSYTRLGHKATMAGNDRQAAIYYAHADRFRRQAEDVKRRAALRRGQ